MSFSDDLSLPHHSENCVPAHDGVEHVYPDADLQVGGDSFSQDTQTDVSFTGHLDHNSGASGFQDDHGMWHWRDAYGGLNDGNCPPPEVVDQFDHAGLDVHSEVVGHANHGTPDGHSDVSFTGYYNKDGTYHYNTDNTDRDPQTGAIIRRY